MAFLFKSKKNQERNVNSRDGPPGSSPQVQGAAGRIAREEKGSRSTPTGSLNSFDEGTPSPDAEKYAVRRGQEPPQAQQPQQVSDLPVSSFIWFSISSFLDHTQHPTSNSQLSSRNTFGPNSENDANEYTKKVSQRSSTAERKCFIISLVAATPNT